MQKGSVSRCEVDGRVSRQLTVHLCSCNTQFCVAHALYTIAVWRVQSMDIVTIVCAHVSWDSPLHMIVYAQAISLRGQTVSLTNTTLLRVQCPAIRGSMVKLAPSTTGIGLIPRSNTRITVILGGASGPLAATILTMMTGPVSGKTAKQVARSRTMRRQTRLPL